MTLQQQKLVNEALAHYHISVSAIEFIRHNENLTCRVRDGEKSYVLRIRRPVEGFQLNIFETGFTPMELMTGEMKILQHLKYNADFPVQVPVCTESGSLVCTLNDGSPACLLEWLDGQALEGDPDGAHAAELGALAAHLHDSLRGIDVPRPDYSHGRIQTMQREITAAYELGHITEKQFAVCGDTLREIDRVMTELDSVPSARSLIHSDMSLGNIIRTPRGLAPIDFSLSGYGYRAQECGMIASNYESEDCQRSVCEGYARASGIEVDMHHLDAFFSMSVLLFISAQHGRFHGEEWFGEAMDRWCDGCFARTIG